MDSPLIAIAGTLLGVLVGAWLTYRFSLDLTKTNAKHFAAIKLREAFFPELANLKYFSQNFTLGQSEKILEAAFEKHYIAVNEFRFYLEGDELEAFTQAWREYYGYPHEDRSNFGQYMALPDMIKKAIDRIEAILAFTKEK
jgi:hypothetical protein